MSLHFGKIGIGQKFLGCIKQINDHSMIISLPDYLTGSISFKDISPTMTDIFKKDPENASLITFYRVGEPIVCSVKSITKAENGNSKGKLELSLLPSLVNKSNAALEEGVLVAAEIISKEEKGFQASIGLEDYKAFIPFKSIDNGIQNDNVLVGKTIMTSVSNVKSPRFVQLTTKSIHEQCYSGPFIGNMMKVLVEEKTKSGSIKICFSGLRGIINDYNLEQKYENISKDDKIKARLVFIDEEREIYIFSILPNVLNLEFINVDELPLASNSDSNSPSLFMGTVERINQKVGILLQIKDEEMAMTAFVHKNRISDKRTETINLKLEQIVKCRLLSHDIFSSTFVASLQESILSQKIVTIQDLKEGDLIEGKVKIIQKFGAIVIITETIQALCPTVQISETQTEEALEEISVGKKYKFRVLNCDSKKKRVILTRKRGLIESNDILTSFEQASVGDYYDGYISSIQDFGAVVKFYGRVRGILPASEMMDEIPNNKNERAQDNFQVGQVVKCRILTAQGEHLALSLRTSSGPKRQRQERKEVDLKEEIETENDQNQSNKNSIENKDLNIKSKKRLKEGKRDESIKQESDQNLEKIKNNIIQPLKKIKNNQEIELLTLDDFVQEEKEEIKIIEKKRENDAQVPSSSHINSSLSNSNSQSPSIPSCHSLESVDKRQEKETKNKSTLESKDENELDLVDLVNEFERRLLSAPNDSKLWIQYMALLIKATEYDQARSVAERALQTIAYREQEEKFNIWIAYLNLENIYGNVERRKTLFSRALVYNEPKKVFIQMAKIFEESNKHVEAKETYQTMIKKFSTSCKIWVFYAQYLFNQKHTIEIRKLLPMALKSLPKRKHIKIQCKFAHLEYKKGNIERGRTLFESVIANSPKKFDVWSVYITLEENKCLAEDLVAIEYCHRLFERVLNQKLSVKKAKFFFKRYLEFEKINGTDSTIEHVKELARKYVENNEE